VRRSVLTVRRSVKICDRTVNTKPTCGINFFDLYPFITYISLSLTVYIYGVVLLDTSVRSTVTEVSILLLLLRLITYST
jgi:hypothetical protein